MGPRARLALLLAAIAVAWAGFWLFQPFAKDDVQAWIEPLGAAAPVAFLATSVPLLGLTALAGVWAVRRGIVRVRARAE